MAESNSWIWWLIGGGAAISVALALREAVAEAAVRQEAVDEVVAAGSLLQPPVTPLRVTSGYGSRIDPITGQPGSWHPGLDLSADFMQPVFAAESGLVSKTLTEVQSGGYGNHVEIDHGIIGGHKLVTTYSHLTEIYVRQGQMVDGGETVGGAGTTGRSTGVHLHFEVVSDGQKVNPKPYIGL